VLSNAKINPMSTLAEIEAAVDSLPPAEQKELLDFLAARVKQSPILERPVSKSPLSVLEIPVLSVGEVLIPFTADDDLLGEMLEGRV
jgi:hypothetical protein